MNKTIPVIKIFAKQSSRKIRIVLKKAHAKNIINLVATYIFKGNWEEASKLTKCDIISGNMCYERLIHTDKCDKNVASVMAEQ